MRDPFEQLRRISESITRITNYTSKGRDVFDAQEEIRISILYYLKIIAEAARATSQDFKYRHPEIPWEQIAHLTSIEGIHTEQGRLWECATDVLPLLKTKVDVALKNKAKTSENSEKRDTATVKATTAALRELLQVNRENILRVAARKGASNVRIFGSVARGEADTESDIDLLVDVKPDSTLSDISELLEDLQTLLGRNIDIATEQGLSGRVRERILKEAIPL